MTKTNALFTLFLSLTISSISFAQESDGLLVDSVMNAKINQAWNEVREYHKAKSDNPEVINPQESYPPELFDYYLKHAGEPTGDKRVLLHF